MNTQIRKRTSFSVAASFFITTLTYASISSAHGPDDEHDLHLHDADGNSIILENPGDLNAPLVHHDAITSGIVSSGPQAKVTKNLDVTGRGERLVTNATTDVWSHNGYAYTGTFNSPCGGDPEAGIWVWDVSNANKPSQVTVIPSPTGSRTNDVRVAGMNSGSILVHSNEPCAGGPGGFEIFNVDNPANPIHLAHVQIDEGDLSAVSPLFFAGGLEDVGVHNLFLFTQGGNDYVGAVAEGAFDNFRIYDITDPADPQLISAWGAEELFDPGVGDLTLADDLTGGRTLAAVLDVLQGGFGASSNKRLHDITISTDGSRAYLANWDAGLVLLDISDVANPQVISVALDPVAGSLDGEVNSHSVWPSEDGNIVVEGEEDFSVFESSVPFAGSMQSINTIPATGTSTDSGDALEASQTGNVGTLTASALTVTTGPLAGSSFAVLDMVTNNHPLGAGSVTGNLVWIGRACNGDALENIVNDGDIAIVRRGACFFSDKAANAAAVGAAAVVIANNQLDSVWSGLRIWDYSDEANPVLMSTFDTVCSANPSDASCDPAGTYSVHNVVVETTGNKTRAYVSWYSDGMLVLDVSDPANPLEVARFLDDSTNGGNPNDFWGVYKEAGSPRIYGSDRNGGLYIFKEKGAGSAKKGAAKKP